MGLFQFLFGGKPNKLDRHPISVWMNEEAKFAGIERTLKEIAAGDSMAVLVIGHFADAFQKVQSIVQHFDDKKGPNAAPAIAMLASELNDLNTSRLRLTESNTIDLIIAQLHPLPGIDDQVMQNFVQGLPCKCRVYAHISFEDPLMSVFAGDFAVDMMKKMGMKEDECVESKMVSRRIRLAQQQIAAAATSNRDAETIGQWLALNCPQIHEK